MINTVKGFPKAMALVVEVCGRVTGLFDRILTKVLFRPNSVSIKWVVVLQAASLFVLHMFMSVFSVRCMVTNSCTSTPLEQDHHL